jgi:hypothetical protein
MKIQKKYPTCQVIWPASEAALRLSTVSHRSPSSAADGALQRPMKPKATLKPPLRSSLTLTAALLARTLVRGSGAT